MFLVVSALHFPVLYLLHVCGDFSISSRHLESDDQIHLELPDVDFEAQVKEEGLDGLVCDIDQPELL